MMITIAEYVWPRTVAEAQTLLATRPDAAIVGGGVFMRMASRKIGLAIDLSRAGLDFINETDTAIEIGAMTTFGALEKSAALSRYFDGLIPKAIGNIPGVQLRNMVTVGGTVYGRYGFSELITALLALDCQVVLHKAGEMSLADFLQPMEKDRDILVKIRLKSQALRASYQMFRNSAGSLPILSVAVTKSRAGYRIAVGARPGVATLAEAAMAYLSTVEKGDAALAKAGEMAAAELSFGNDRRASAAYRSELCKVLVKRALLEVER
jgi:CO/xanthine dehydrogenase FAD-binding subunit